MPAGNQTTDRKKRFGGLLENPWISKVQRNILDYGRWQGLSRTLLPLRVSRVLDIGCGLGENSRVAPQGYVGLDNSFPRIRFAAGQYAASHFVLADALHLPVRRAAFDLAMLIDTSHHLTDDQFLSILDTMQAASRRWVLVSDPVPYNGQSALSRFFYKLDRGAQFRDRSGMIAILKRSRGLKLDKVEEFTTFPGLYRHGVFLLKVC